MALLFNSKRVRPVFGKAERQSIPTRPPEGNGLADGRSDARRIGHLAESPSAVVVVSHAAASDLPFSQDRGGRVDV